MRISKGTAGGGSSSAVSSGEVGNPDGRGSWWSVYLMLFLLSELCKLEGIIHPQAKSHENHHNRAVHEKENAPKTRDQLVGRIIVFEEGEVHGNAELVKCVPS